MLWLPTYFFHSSWKWFPCVFRSSGSRSLWLCCPGNALTCPSLSLLAGQQISVIGAEAGVREIIFGPVLFVLGKDLNQADCQSGEGQIAGSYEVWSRKTSCFWINLQIQTGVLWLLQDFWVEKNTVITLCSLAVPWLWGFSGGVKAAI